MSDRPRILLVDDENALLQILEDVLTEAGFAVTKAATGAAALEILDAEISEIRGLITDIRLPAPSGWDLARHGRSLLPELAVVYVTGDSAGDWSAEGVPNSVLVAKPFAPAQVVTAISSLLTVGGTGG